MCIIEAQHAKSSTHSMQNLSLLLVDCLALRLHSFHRHAMVPQGYSGFFSSENHISCLIVRNTLHTYTIVLLFHIHFFHL